ncbi:proprotein convertase subtilisin/kexin type 5-like [Lampris incognitus]|uniref:proprotein convertase subtilisin/kexin type 5-like n=1 Tax=Lampris incognitus TaxID=2546036 RepID=UPI0024B4AC71|nr:proprotein convertase subtilisin/kexin type 5-like [Lampris incognitus]
MRPALRVSSILGGNSVSHVPTTVLFAQQQITASTAAQGIDSETAAVCHWSVVKRLQIDTNRELSVSAVKMATTKSQDCEPCHRTCRTCGGPRYDDCDSCEEGFLLKGGECLDRTRARCPDTHFKNRQEQCEQCHSSCKTCSAAGQENCNTCDSGTFLTLQQSCVSHCPPGTFANKTSGQCEDCLPGCVLCQDAWQCQRCRSRPTQLYLQDGLCVVDCQRGFPQGDACQPCDPKCLSCQGNASHCLSCASQYLLLNHSCMRQCPEEYYTTEAKCLRCPPNCKECNRDGLCKACAHYYYLHKDKCVDDCPAGYFVSEEQQECVRCHADCASCDGPDVDDCNVCKNLKAVRYNGECLARCPTNTYHDMATSECRVCDGSCLTCSGPEPSSCLSCASDMRKDETGHCVWYSQCSLRSYMGEDGACQLCHPMCHRCSGSGNHHCLSCNAPHFLLNNTCVEECPEGYYGDKDEHACKVCHPSCKSCVGHHSVQCATCKPGFYRQGYSCVETCSESHFVNTTSGVCERCHSSCEECILSVNFILRGPEELEALGSPAKHLVTICVLFIIAAGGVVYLFLQARSKLHPVSSTSKTKAGGYQKLDSKGDVSSQLKASSFGEYRDRIIECEEGEEEDDEEDDIVYMAQDGTVYRRFKYGLLDEDEEIELEYDDESYSFK